MRASQRGPRAKGEIPIDSDGFVEYDKTNDNLHEVRCAGYERMSVQSRRIAAAPGLLATRPVEERRRILHRRRSPLTRTLATGLVWAATALSMGWLMLMGWAGLTS
jgi:ferric-dicitrate binding protein FerR (iron transport regulator)